MQIIYGLLLRAMAVPLPSRCRLDGNTADPMTLPTQIEKLKRRFQLDHACWSATAA